MHRLTSIVLLVIGYIFFAACTGNKNQLFTALDKSNTNINFQNTLFEDGPLNVANYIYFYNGGGVSIGDINNDGLQDILFTGNMVRNRLYLNKGNFTFEDITTQSGVADKQGWCTGATMADVNGDGLLDIYICRSADINPAMRTNLLFMNNGNLTFSEKAGQYGLADTGYSTQSAFFDYDKDGDLDCFIINHSLSKYTAGVQDNPELRNEHNPAFANKLYRNDNGHYSDVSGEAGITSNVLTFGLGLAVTDFNNDGWPDVYVSNDFNEPDYLFMNNRNGSFTESLRTSMDDISLYSMGSDAADYNNDGLPDLVTLDMMPESNFTQKMHSGAENFDKFQYLFNQGFYFEYSRNMLQKNNGDGTFSEVAQLAGVSNTDWSWTALFGDYDNDGNKDLFITNGYVKDYTEMDFLKYSVDRVVRKMHGDSVDAITEYIRKMPTLEIPNYVFQNNGNETFTKKTSEWGLDQPGVSAGAAYADLDNDGDLDLVVNNTNNFAGIYKNNSEAIGKNNYLRVQLAGTATNPRAIGTKVTLYCKGQQYYQEESPVRGFQSSSDPVLSFGVGTNAVIDSVLVIWPNNAYQLLTNIKPNQTLSLKMTDAKQTWVYDTTVNKKTIFTQTIASNIKHTENSFNDFTVQLLLPNYMSRQGPSIATADVNKDGLDDIFMGGAKGKAGQLFLQNATGGFLAKQVPAFLQDSVSEDVSAVFFDADNDGDQDLYVASGGYEFDEFDPAFQDRLYLNDGKANFTKSVDALPKMLCSKSCVKAADIDGDGDIDLFVGGRLVPGKYPTAPRSFILANNGKGVFTDVTASVCNALMQPGMVTDAAFVDVNNDKTQDLVIVGEWMQIQVYTNKAGKFTDASASYIHFASTGWWNKIYTNDIDGDGDADLVIGNCGLNTQFKVSEKEPMNLYYKDFDNNGSIDPILCYFIQGVSYPANSRDDLTDQLPGLKKKFLEYKGYASATINDLFTPEVLKDAKILKVETMLTIYLENQGPAKGFALHNLPQEAQYAPVFGMVAEDFNNDGKKDLLLAGNETWTRIKFGRYRANHGVLLQADGKGNFTYVPQTKSGLQLNQNVKVLLPIKTGNKKTFIAGINDGNALFITAN